MKPRPPKTRDAGTYHGYFEDSLYGRWWLTASPPGRSGIVRGNFEPGPVHIVDGCLLDVEGNLPPQVVAWLTFTWRAATCATLDTSACAEWDCPLPQ